MPKQNKTVLAVVADTHGGSSTGLLPPGSWVGLDGQTWQPSTGQRDALWPQWVECWERVRELRKGGRLVVVHNGDAIENTHHDTTQVITNEIEEQKRIHLAAMDKALDMCRFGKEDKLFYVYGTETHVHGTEDDIARDLGAVPCIEPTAENEWRDGRFVHYHLKLNINGVRFDIAHHGIGAGKLPWTKHNGAASTAKAHYFASLERGVKPYNYIVASHNHEYTYGVHEGSAGRVEAMITPAFQTKTHFGNKVARPKLADIGMIIFVIEADGRHYKEVPMISFDEIGEMKL